MNQCSLKYTSKIFLNSGRLFHCSKHPQCMCIFSRLLHADPQAGFSIFICHSPNAIYSVYGKDKSPG